MSPPEAATLALVLALVEAFVAESKPKAAARFLRRVSTILAEPPAVLINCPPSTREARRQAAAFWRAHVADLLRRVE